MKFKKRPWGFWIKLFGGKHFKVKLIRFKAGQSLSLQKHRYRRELWCFLSGYGLLRIGDEYIKACKGDAHSIIADTWHKYTAGATTWVLEIQNGFKCEEEDIERKE